MDCRIVNREELSEKYLQGKLDSERQDEFEAHLIECAKCLRELELLQTVRQDLAERAHEIRGWTPRKGFFFRWKTVAVAVVVMVVIAGGIASFFQSHSVPPKINVVVLPFTNLSGDPNQDDFSAGLTDEMITRMGTLDPQRLRVVAAPSSNALASKPIAEIGRAVNAQYVVEGSIRRNGNHVRIDVRLIQLSDRPHFWADSYEGDLNDILRVQDDVSTAVAGQIYELNLSTGKGTGTVAKRTVNPDTYDDYLRGRSYRGNGGKKEAGDTLIAQLGQYDEALRQYHRALDLHRNAGDMRGAAFDSYSMGTLFDIQGRYGAAVSSEEEAVKTFRELQDRSADMAEFLSGYGAALAEAGRGEEAQKALDEALGLARELKSQPHIARSLNRQGDAAFYRGDFKAARTLYGQALQAASHAKDRDKLLESKIGLAKVAIREGHPREAGKSLKNLAKEADGLGSKYLSVECSVDLAEALVNSKNYPQARKELETALGRAEKLGLRTLQVRGHYLLATALRATGNKSEAAGHNREAVRMLDEMRKEVGAEKVLERADLKPIYEESNRWSQPGQT